MNLLCRVVDYPSYLSFPFKSAGCSLRSPLSQTALRRVPTSCRVGARGKNISGHSMYHCNLFSKLASAGEMTQMEAGDYLGDVALWCSPSGSHFRCPWRGNYVHKLPTLKCSFCLVFGSLWKNRLGISEMKRVPRADADADADAARASLSRNLYRPFQTA